jgi:single-strand DNA-binding protein
MANLKMPEINCVIIAGNLTKDPVFRQTTSGIPVANFTIACNRKYRDTNDQWQEEVCYVGVVAWNRLAVSCSNRMRKGSAVLIDGELQNHSFKSDDGSNRSIIEIKARRIQFLDKKEFFMATNDSETILNQQENGIKIFEDDSFEKFLSDHETKLLKDQLSFQQQEK